MNILIRFKQRWFVLFLTLIGALSAIAQQRTIKGNVKDDIGEPAIGASVRVPGTTIGTMTDFDGNYTLLVPEDAKELMFSYIGLESKTLPISDSCINIAFDKPHDIVCSIPGYRYQSLPEVVVTGTRNSTDIRHLPMTISVVNRSVLTGQHRTNLLPTVMQRVPGLFVTSRSMTGYGVSNGAAGGISLRGITGESGQMMVLIDGQPQYNGIYGHPISDSYQTMMADRVEVLRGPASVLYGSNAMGGVVNIVTRSADNPGTQTDIQLGGGSYGTFEAEASTQTRTRRFSSNAAVQYNRSDNHRPHMGFEQYGGLLQLRYKIRPHWKTSAMADITHFIASNPGPTNAPLYDADQWITRGMVSAALENNYYHTNGALRVYSNFGQHKIDDGTTDFSRPTQRYFRSKDALTGISLYQSLRLFYNTRIAGGFDWQNIYGNAWYTSKQTGERLNTPNKQSGRSYRNEIAGYIDLRQTLVQWLTIDAGIRMDHHSVSGTEWIPQVGLALRPTHRSSLKAMATKGFRNPTMRELYLYPPSNENLKPERIWSYELAWQHQPIRRLNYGANLFYINGDNMIQTVNRKNINTGRIENCGMELEATYRLGEHWSFTTNHALLHMEKPVTAAPEYLGHLIVDYHNRHWTINAALQCVNGLYTSVDNNNEHQEDFYLLNLGATYTVNRFLSIWTRGDNLLAQRYEIIQGYPMPKATFMGGVNIRF